MFCPSYLSTPFASRQGAIDSPFANECSTVRRAQAGPSLPHSPRLYPPLYLPTDTPPSTRLPQPPSGWEPYQSRSGDSRGRWSAARRNNAAASPSSAGAGPADTFPNSPSVSPQGQQCDSENQWEEEDVAAAVPSLPVPVAMVGSAAAVPAGGCGGVGARAGSPAVPDRASHCHHEAGGSGGGGGANCSATTNRRLPGEFDDGCVSG